MRIPIQILYLDGLNEKAKRRSRTGDGRQESVDGLEIRAHGEMDGWPGSLKYDD